MRKVGIVSCNKWKEKIDEDQRLKLALEELNIKANIISWEEDELDDYDLLILRSVWGYQNNYENFKSWLLKVKKSDIELLNSPDIILTNIQKNKQFNILNKYNIEHIDTVFLTSSDLYSEEFSKKLLKFVKSNPIVIKPTISGSGENTFLLDINNINHSIPNTIEFEQVRKQFEPLMRTNSDLELMIQPYISEINYGEYSCIFVDGQLTHTMLRFPNVFHDKQKPYLIEKFPKSILNLAYDVEQIPEFKGYLYMRVDMVVVNNSPKIMEVELAEPDLLTKYIEDQSVQNKVVKVLSKSIKRRVK